MDPILPISPADRARITPVPPTPRIGAATPDGRQPKRDADGRRRGARAEAEPDPYGEEDDELPDTPIPGATPGAAPGAPRAAADGTGPDHRPHIDISA